jgi:hypothetical protein
MGVVVLLNSTVINSVRSFASETTVVFNPEISDEADAMCTALSNKAISAIFDK